MFMCAAWRGIWKRRRRGSEFKQVSEFQVSRFPGQKQKLRTGVCATRVRFPRLASKGRTRTWGTEPRSKSRKILNAEDAESAAEGAETVVECPWHNVFVEGETPALRVQVFKLSFTLKAAKECAPVVKMVLRPLLTLGSFDCVRLRLTSLRMTECVENDESQRSSFKVSSFKSKAKDRGNEYPAARAKFRVSGFRSFEFEDQRQESLRFRDRLVQG